MGVMRFEVHPPELGQPWQGWECAYVSGLGGRIFATRPDFDGSILTCRRSQNDSGKVCVPWPVSGHGMPLVSTASLREREQPYVLSLELARGKLCEVRDQAAIWEMGRMSIPEAFRTAQQKAFRAFARASSCGDELAIKVGYANESLKHAFDAAEILIGAYSVQRLASVRRTQRHAPGLLGAPFEGDLSDPQIQSAFDTTFDTVCVPLKWTHIEPEEGQYNWQAADDLVRWAAEKRKILSGGPLVDLSPNGLPPWLAPWKNDVLNLPSFVCDYVDTVIGRYAGLIRMWEVSTAGNTGGALDLSEEHRLALVARTLEAAVRKDADSQFFIRIEQPWGEYQRSGRHRLSPFEFVDAIIRSSMGLTGVTLEINAGYCRNGCISRDLLSISRLIDQWSMLGVQLHVALACPSATTTDTKATPISVSSNWKDKWSIETQADWFELVLPLLLAKPAVTGVFLQQFDDSIPHKFPHAGAIDDTGKQKPVLDAFRGQRGEI
ncbi:MAG: endo-1,4-beta-xylanase [Planctomycetaceae bacterium]|nr:endo-1,4-beta-xylanase [Planctomycetaceae bacterium]MCB9950786.1 endo-1,4-beta-xylanase [Planctomycetaceae bacterium]